MNQPFGVSRRESLGDLAADAQHFENRQLRLAPQAVFERLSFEILHRQKRDARLFTDLIDGDDVIVPQRRRRARPHQFQGDSPPKLQVFGQKHASHPIPPAPSTFKMR